MTKSGHSSPARPRRPRTRPPTCPPTPCAPSPRPLNGLLADAFALYMKTKNFHWHVSGPHFRDYHLLLDEQAEQIFASTDELAERVRKIGGITLRSIGDIAKHQTIKDNDEAFVAAHDMLRELMADNKAMAAAMRNAHEIARQARGCGHREPARDLHRRHRAAHVVPVRGQPRLEPLSSVPIAICHPGIRASEYPGPGGQRASHLHEFGSRPSPATTLRALAAPG